MKTIRVSLGDGDDDLVVVIPAGGAPVTASGDSGTDTVEYTLPSGRVTVSFDGTANDGPLPGHDNVTGFEAVRGGAKADTLTGGPSADTLFGLRGEDHLNGGAGNDLIDARDVDNCPFLGGNCPEPLKQDEPERDTVHCGPGTDTVDGDAKDKIARDCEFAVIDNSLTLSNKRHRFTAFRNGLSSTGTPATTA